MQFSRRARLLVAALLLGGAAHLRADDGRASIPSFAMEEAVITGHVVPNSE